MIENGYWLLFGDSMVNIYADRELKELVANFPMKGNRCFPMKFEFMNLVMANKAAVEDHSWKWHRRFGHLNYVGLKMLQDKEMVLGLPRLDNFGDVCEGCATGKAHREAFDKNEVWRASQPLELVHSDVYGPMQVTTIGGNKYFLTFIDDHTRMCWVFLL